MIFGIYPLNVAGTPFGIAQGAPDDFAKIREALNELRGEKTLNTRLYLIYTPDWAEKMLANLEIWSMENILSDLVIGVGDWTNSEENSLNLTNWCNFVREVIQKFGSKLTSVQITNEPNLSFMEGSKPYIYDALIQGVLTAKAEIESQNLNIEVGFGSVPESQVAVADFWQKLSEKADENFLTAIDFVSHNYYIDVFDEVPVKSDEIPSVVEKYSSELRSNLMALGLSENVNIRVGENGWPTGKNLMTRRVRMNEEQVEKLEKLVRSVAEISEKYRISHYNLFDLRDADSSKEDLFNHYGIMTEDYSPKLAFETYKNLIKELGN